jgi:hypothetical protein
LGNGQRAEGAGERPKLNRTKKKKRKKKKSYGSTITRSAVESVVRGTRHKLLHSRSQARAKAKGRGRSIAARAVSSAVRGQNAVKAKTHVRAVGSDCQVLTVDLPHTKRACCCLLGGGRFSAVHHVPSTRCAPCPSTASAALVTGRNRAILDHYSLRAVSLGVVVRPVPAQ